MALTPNSKAKLRGVHPDLIAVVERASAQSEVRFLVLEGVRTLERQEQLVAQGASRTMRSRHLTGHAVDLGAWETGQIVWHWPLYHKIAKAMKKAARDLGIPVEWGGDWKTFPDGPHFQLKRESPYLKPVSTAD